MTDRAEPPGLSSADLTSIREGLAAGRRQKVVFTPAAGQIAGQSGQVVAFADPDTTDEWVVVRFGRDELPFAPADLALPGRAGRRRAAQPRPAVPAPRRGPVVTKSTVDAPQRTVRGPVHGTRPAGSRAAGAGDGVPVESAARPAARAATRPKPPAALTVTLAYTAGEWTLGAMQGAKAIAKPYPVKPSAALRLVSMMDIAGLPEAVERIVAAERVQAQREADRLRAQLAELEARLVELAERR
jgi:hypothetical protein